MLLRKKDEDFEGYMVVVLQGVDEAKRTMPSACAVDRFLV